MSLLDRITAELKQAMIEKQVEKLSVLRMLKSAIQYSTMEKSSAGQTPGDTEVIAVIRKEVKKRHDSIESFEKAQRLDLAEKEKKEATILNAFLPQALSEAEVEKLVKDSIAEAGATQKSQMGAVMKLAQAKAAGRVEGKTLSQLVNKLLS